MAEATPPVKPSPAGERQRLLQEIEWSRRQLAADFSDLGQAVNVRERFRDAIRKHPAWWLGGGIVAGLALATLIASPGRRSRGRKGDDTGMLGTAKRSLFLGLLGFAGKQILHFSEPALKHFAQQHIESWIESRSSRPGPDPGGPKAFPQD